MSKAINIYYRIKETGEEFRDKETITIDKNIGEKYTFEKTRMNKYGVTNYFPLYGVNNGAVSSERIADSDGYRKISCSGYLSNNETENNWILYFSETDPSIPDIENEPLSAEMTTNTDNVRIGVSDYPRNPVSAYIESSDSVLFDSVTISTGAMSESFYTYGSTFSPSCTIVMTPNSLITVGKYIRVEFSIDGVWQLFGIFYVNTPPTMTSEQMTVNATGLLSSILDNTKYTIREWESGVKSPTLLDYDNSIYVTIPRLIDYTLNTADVEIIFDFEDKLKAYNYEENYYKYSAYVFPSKILAETGDHPTGIKYVTKIGQEEAPTIRELLSLFAVIFHSNVIERNGRIHITHNSVGDYDKNVDLFGEDTYSEEPEMRLNSYFSPCEIKVECGKMARNIDSGLSYPGDDGTLIEMDFPGYTEESENEVTILDSTYSGEKQVANYPVTISAKSLWCEVTEIKPKDWGNKPWSIWPIREYAKAIGVVEPFIYYPVEAEFLGFNPYIYAGGVIKAEFSGIKRDIYIGNLTISWDGMMSMQVSTPCDVEATGNSSGTSSPGSVSSSFSTGISGGTMSAIITGQIFKDGVIEGSKIKDSTITGSKIEESTLTGSLFEDGTITGSKIDNSTITNSHIVDGTLDGSTKIANATIDFEKVDTSFIDDLTANDAYVQNFKADVANIDFLTADDAIIKNIQATAISADYIRATTADFGYMTADEADIKYADITFGNIDTANIDIGNIGLLFNEVGLIDRATIVDGHISGYLDAVQIRADSITSGTLDAGVIDVTNLNAANITVGTINGYQISPGAIDMDNLAESVTGEIDSANTNAQSAVDKALEAFENANSAVETANTAQTTADGKNTVFYQASAPSGQHKINDVWFDTDDSNKMYYWNGSTWTVRQFGTSAIANASITNALIADATIQSAKIANLDAGKITTGTLSADRIGANTITARKIVMSDFTNYATINENFPITMLPTSAFGGTLIEDGYVTKKSKTDTYLMFCDYSVNDFKGGEKIYYEMMIKGEVSGSVVLGIWFYDSGYVYKTSASTGQIAVDTTEKTISSILTVPSGALGKHYFVVGLYGAGNLEQKKIYVRKVKCIRQNGAELIVDGAITTNKLYAGAVTTDKIGAGEVKAGNIYAGAITADKIAANAVTSDKLYVGNGGNLYATGYDTFDSIPNTAARIYYLKNSLATVSIDSTNAYYGKKCLKIVSGDTDGYVYLGDSLNGYGCIPVVAGKTYIVSAWMKASKNTEAELFVIGHSSKNSTPLSYNQMAIETIGTSWTRIFGRYTAISSQPYISIRVDNNTNGATLWVDAIQIETGTATQTPSEFSPAGMTVVDGGNILTNTITANSIDINNVFANNAVLTKIFAQDITATGTITGATLMGAYAEIDGGTIGDFSIADGYLQGLEISGGIRHGSGFSNTRVSMSESEFPEKDPRISYSSEMRAKSIASSKISTSGSSGDIAEARISYDSIEISSSVNSTADVARIKSNEYLIERSSGDTFYRAKRRDTGVEVGFGVGTAGINHGIWSYKQNRWLLYGDASNIYLGNYNTGSSLNPIYFNNGVPKKCSFSVQRGKESVTIQTSGENRLFTVTFATSFSSAPIVVATPVFANYTSNIGIRISAVSNKSFSAVLVSSATGSHTINWVAVGS